MENKQNYDICELFCLPRLYKKTHIYIYKVLFFISVSIKYIYLRTLYYYYQKKKNEIVKREPKKWA